jgi:hypothetical protein
MQQNNRSLKQFKCMPFPAGYVTDFLGNRLIYDERNYDPVQQAQLFNELFATLTGNASNIVYYIPTIYFNTNIMWNNFFCIVSHLIR